jgi:hypothetical protein
MNALSSHFDNGHFIYDCYDLPWTELPLENTKECTQTTTSTLLSLPSPF